MPSDKTRDPAIARLWVLGAILFISYICVAASLPVVPVFVSHGLHYGTALAGLSAGVAYLSTLLTRASSGRRADERGGKPATAIGLGFYVAGAIAAMLAGIPGLPGPLAYAILVIGRLLIGAGESLVTVGITGWGIGIVGPHRSGRVLAVVGAAMYGAYVVGAPAGLALYNALGFTYTMAACAVLPVCGILAMRLVPGVAPMPKGEHTSFIRVIGAVWRHGMVIFLQGVGFASIGAFFTLYFLKQGWPMAALGLTAFGAGFVLVRILFGHMPDRFGGLRVAIVSLAVETVGLACIWMAAGPSAALVGAFMTGLGCSMIYPSMGREVVGLVAPHLRATAVGGFGLFQDFAYGLTGPVAGLLAQQAGGYRGIFLGGTICAALGLCIAVWLRHRETMVETGEARNT